MIEAHPALSLWPAVWKMMQLRLLIFFSGFRRGRLRRKIGLILVAVLVLAFVVFLLVMSWLLLKFLRSPELAQFVGDPVPFLENIERHRRFWKQDNIGQREKWRNLFFPADYNQSAVKIRKMGYDYDHDNFNGS